MAKTTIDLTEFVKLNAKVLHVFGYFFPDFKKLSIEQFIYFIYSMLAVGSAIISSIASLIAYFISVYGDISKMLESLFLISTYGTQLFKLYSFLYYGSKIWILLYKMNENMFQPQSSVQCDILLRDIQTSKIITKAFLFGCTLTCMWWSVTPLTEEKKDGKNIRLPLTGWYPFKTDKSPAFELVYIYQCVSTWFNGLADVSMDTFISGILMFVSSQLSILSNELEIMEEKIAEDNTSKRNISNHLVRNINHYKSIIAFSKEAGYLFSAGVTGQFVKGVITSCMAMFHMSVVPIQSSQFLGMLLYQTCLFVEMFLYCFYGNEIILKSDKLTQSAYACEWVDAPKEFKQNLVIFMTRTQFPIRLYAAGYFTLSIESLKNIAKTSWSYFVVLKQVYN